MEAGKSVGWEWDLKTGRLSWFGDLQNMFGIPSDTYVGRREDLYHYVHPEDHELVAKASRRMPDKAENHTRPSFGSSGLTAYCAGSPGRGQFYYGSHGDTQRMLGIAVDITERRQVQEALHLFRNLIDQSSDAIEVVDPETLRFLDVNESACRDLGYTRDELLSLSVPDIDPVLNESMKARNEGELDQSGFVTFESLHQRKDGLTFPVEINLKRVELDRNYNVNIVRDITQRKRTEEALRQKSEELTEAQRLAGLGSWQWDARTDAVIWSEVLYRLLGRDPNLPPPPLPGTGQPLRCRKLGSASAAVGRALQAGDTYELDMEIIGAGPTKWATPAANRCATRTVKSSGSGARRKTLRSASEQRSTARERGKTPANS